MRKPRRAIARRPQPVAQVHYVDSPSNRLSYYDPLTRLPNRGLLMDRLDQALMDSARSGLFGALYNINVKNFRALNSAEGHDAGDRLLIQLAARLRGVVRDSDSVARQWGDEFLILVEDLGDNAALALESARLLGERLRCAFVPPVDLLSHLYPCQLHIGISLFTQADKVEGVFTHAAMALEQSYLPGADSLCFFEPRMQSTQERRLTLAAEMEKALHWQQLRLFYQPQLDRSLCVVGVEALLRWQHPLRGLVPPDEFIPLAEESELIIPIGLWVLNSACEQLKRWEYLPCCCKLQVAVNVSARQFQQADFVALVQQALEHSGANPARLKLELTESLVLNNMDDVVAKMQQIRLLGVRFSMDDFGTGYSSLAYLTQLPIDQLKIDKSFVQNIPGKSSDELIARTIIAMGLGLGMNVIAEGVETPEQHVFLAQHGCHAYQGYLFSRPLPLEALEAYLKAAPVKPDLLD